MTEKLKFPFEPNERVKAAFRNEVGRKQALEAMTRALLEVSSQVANPWDILREEYPELKNKIKKCKVSYNYFTELVDIREIL